MAKEKDDELTIVGPAAEDDDVRDESDERAEGGSEEEGQEEEHADAEGDERVGHTDDQDDDRAAIRERRRNEKLRKKENRNRERLELNFLRQRNEQLERRQSEFDARLSQGEIVSIDNKIAELDGQIREAERIKALAINKSDGESAAEADRIARDLSAGRNQLVSIRDQRVQGARTRTTTQPQTDPAVINAAREWAESHPWYDPNLRNADSRVAKAIEDQIFQEGRLDARDEEYWNELDRRLKKYMPHRFGNGHNTREDEDDTEDREDVRTERRSRGPRITTGGRERPLRKNEVYISAERKQAMIDANIWDDPVLREKQLKAYQRYDREARNRH